jgi:hypothetical protein
MADGNLGMPYTARVLLVGFDSPEWLAGRLQGLGFEPVVGATLDDALEALESTDPPLSVCLLPPDPCLADVPQALQLLRERSLHGALGFLTVGPRPRAGEAVRLGRAGVRLACWEPFSDGELRFLVNHLLYSPRKGESRNDPRVPTTLEARVHGRAPKRPARVYSLSVGGAFLETECPRPVDEEVLVELPLPALTRTIQARVVSSRAAGELERAYLPPGMGVRFLEMDGATLAVLAEYVEERSRRFQLQADPGGLLAERGPSQRTPAQACLGESDRGAGPTHAKVGGHSTPASDGSATETGPMRIPLVRRRQAERRAAERVWMGCSVSYRTEIRERPALLADLSWRGCRILTAEEQEPDAPITLSFPKELVNDGSSLLLPGWVLRCQPDSSDREWPISIAVVFDELTRESGTRLGAVLGSKLDEPARGPASARADASADSASARGRTGDREVGRPSTFGRYLLDRGFLSRSQLEEVTRSMVVFGGRLGTHLVEAGVLDADELEAHLAAHLGVRAAPADRIESPHRKAIEAIPRSLIRRRKVFPFDQDPDALHVAMRDPWNDGLCEELARATGLRIEPYLVSEVRLFAQLERYFGLDRNLRYARSRLSPAPGRTGEAEPPLILLEEFADLEPESDDLPFRPLGEGEELIDQASFARFYQGRLSFSEELPPAQDEELAPERPADEGSSHAPGGLDAGAVARFESTLGQASDRAEVFRCALQIARTHVRSAALFTVRDVIEGVAAAGEVERTDLRGVLVPCQGDSMLASAAQTGEIVRGAPASGSVDERLLRFVRPGEVREVAFIPVAIRGRTVNVLCVDNGPDGLAESSLAALSALSERMRESYERIIVERKRRI